MPIHSGGTYITTMDASQLGASTPELAASPVITPRDSPLNDYLRPLRISAFAPYTLRVIPLVGGVPSLSSAASPARVGLLLSHSGSSATTVQVGPLRDGSLHPVLWVPGLSVVGGTLGELLSLIGAEWWALSPTDVTLYITEFTRPY